MSASPVDICNMALSAVGVRRRISALTEESEEARVCRLHYETALDFTLQQDDWPFATRRAELTLIEEDPTDEWDFRYALPDDCSCAQRIETGTGDRLVGLDRAVKFQIEADPEGQRTTILTDQEEAVLVYTTRSQPSSLYPAWFVKLLAANLAVDLCAPLVVNADMTAKADARAARMIHQARAYARNEGQEDEPIDSEFVRARY